jgi:ankyrin repeat protein
MDTEAEAVWRAAAKAVLDCDRASLNALLEGHPELLRTDARRSSDFWTPDCSRDDAGAIIAREHWFSTFEECASHRAALQDERSQVARFEAAVDSVILGDIVTLRRLVREDPELVRVRSPRLHRATLLHYVGANGVESFRQRTPGNAVDVARVLLDAGADVNAAADMYGGADALGLVATSIHPITAGVQEALMQFLLDRGASLANATAGRPVVNACLANGRPSAAAFLADRGAPLDLEGAAGLGRLDLVQRFFVDGETLTAGATEQQMADGFSWACEYGRTNVVEFLLQHRMNVSAKLRPHGQTGLHWAAYGGHAETLRMLLRHAAPVDVRDDTFKTTPLDWALYAWSGGREFWADDGYYEIVERLLEAGAQFDEGSLTPNAVPSSLAKKLEGDRRMQAILSRSG